MQGKERVASMPTRFRYSVALLLDVLVLFRLNLACASRDPLSYGYGYIAPGVGRRPREQRTRHGMRTVDSDI